MSTHELKQLRKDAGLTQKRLGGLLGISESHIRHVEKGQENSSLTLRRFWNQICRKIIEEANANNNRTD